MKKIYFLAGEASGDIHGGDLITSLFQLYPHVKIRAMGGDSMKKAGAQISFDYKEHSIMGFIEVVKNLKKIKRHMKTVVKDIRNFKPDMIVMIDFPGFNMRIGHKIYKEFPLYYFIAPKAWAWKAGRAKALAKEYKRVYSILPFELPFFNKYGVDVQYVGNPSKEQVEKFKENNNKKSGAYVALFPGSRKQEISKILPLMLRAVREIPNIDYKISQAPGISADFYQAYISEKDVLYQNNYDLLYGAKAALVTSGTATLETALFGVPQVVCYVGSPISIAIARLLVKVPYISLVNLILDKTAVTELIQDDCNPRNIRNLVQDLMNDTPTRKNILADYSQLNKKLGDMKTSTEVAKDLIRALTTSF